MAIPPWTIELLRRGLTDVARKAREPETIEKIRTQATEILQDLPQTAARGIDAVIRGAEAGKRSVERWSRKHTSIATPMLNATGILVTDCGTGVPMAAEAIEAGSEVFAGDVVQGAAMSERLRRRLHRLLPAGGDCDILITSSFSSALSAFSLLVEQHQLVVHRHHAVRLPGGLPLPDAIGTLLPVIREVGSADEIAPGDFDGMDNFCAILADCGQEPVELMDFSNRDALQAVVLPVATMATSQDDVPSAESMLIAGADFVLMPGDGLAGGPACGILIGPSDSIDQIRRSVAWPVWAASDAVQAMMMVTLETAASNPDQIPVQQLLTANEENLRGRAERLATRLTGSDRISSCQITADDARLTADGRWRLPSRQIRIRHASRSAQDWSDELREDFPAVFASVDGEDLRVDLRWIAAADDGKLAEALGGSTETEESPMEPTAASPESPETD